MKRWEHPPVIKIYEALGAIADGRITIENNKAKVSSSSGNKFYSVFYDPETNAIMANDNGSFWKGYLGYPAIAFLMKTGRLEYEEKVADLVKDVKWKDLNQKFENDFDINLAPGKPQKKKSSTRHRIGSAFLLLRFSRRTPGRKNPFPYPKKYPPPKKKKEYCKGFFWRAYRRNGVEAEG